jgi:fumarylacetoacetase
MESNASHAYWTMTQLVAYHTVNGCNLQSSDLLGSVTLAGPAPDEGGSLTAGGKNPIRLRNGGTRQFLLDCDMIILKAFCEKSGARRIGFGECRGTVALPPQALAADG